MNLKSVQHLRINMTNFRSGSPVNRMPREKVSWRNSLRRYGAVSLSLHWGMALLVFLMLGLGWGREYAPGIWKPLITQMHVAAGVLLLGLLPVRLFWRFYDRPPALVESLIPVQRLAAHAMHYLLYILLFAMPLSGWLMLSAMGRRPSFLGVIELPLVLEKTPSLVPVFKSVHGLMALGFAAFVILHLGAGLLHHFVHRDETLTRMLPFLKKPLEK